MTPPDDEPRCVALMIGPHPGRVSPRYCFALRDSSVHDLTGTFWARHEFKPPPSPVEEVAEGPRSGEAAVRRLVDVLATAVPDMTQVRGVADAGSDAPRPLQLLNVDEAVARVQWGEDGACACHPGSRHVYSVGLGDGGLSETARIITDALFAHPAEVDGKTIRVTVELVADERDRITSTREGR